MNPDNDTAARLIDPAVWDIAMLNRLLTECPPGDWAVVHWAVTTIAAAIQAKRPNRER
jgi:hypothetical protein